jgi:hypothetical protein
MGSPRYLGRKYLLSILGRKYLSRILRRKYISTIHEILNLSLKIGNQM